MIRNCPATLYTVQGLGFLEQRTNDRTSAVLSLTQRVKAAGYHTFKVGGDVELATYDSARGNTGGAFYEERANPRFFGPDKSALWRARQVIKVSRNLNQDEIDGTVTPPEVDPTSPQFDINATVCSGGRALCTAVDTLHANTN